MDVHPVTGEIYVSEHRPSVYDAPRGGEKINQLIKGGNYGWPIVRHRQTHWEMFSPIMEYTPIIAPSSAVFNQGYKFLVLKNDFFYIGLYVQAIFRLQI